MPQRSRGAASAVALSLAILAGAAGAAVSTPVLADAITGTANDDLLPGTPRRDTIRGLAGNDTSTPGRSDDEALGDRGNDRFRWAKGDGRDRLDGGPDSDVLEVRAAGSLRLHVDILGAGPLVPFGDGQEAVTVTRLENVEVRGSPGADAFTVTTDAGVGGSLYIATGTGRDRVDARGARMRTNIDAAPHPDNGAGDAILGSLEFFDYIVTGSGDDEIRTGRGGSFVDSGLGWDVIRLGAGQDQIFLSPGNTQRRKIVVHGFDVAQDVVELYDIHSDFPRVLDTNGDGWVDARDLTVRIADGSMTVDLSAALDGDPVSLTLVSRTRVALSRFRRTCDC